MGLLTEFLVYFFYLLEIGRLTKIKDALPDHIEYGHIKVIIALMVQKYGKQSNLNGELVVCSSSQESSFQGASSQSGSNNDHQVIICFAWNINMFGSTNITTFVKISQTCSCPTTK